MERVQSAFGVFAMMGFAWLLCPADRRKHVNWRMVGTGLLILIGVALLVLKTPVRNGFSGASDAVDTLLQFSDAGAQFLFGSLAKIQEPWGMVFAFRVLPTIIFFAALMSLLYYVGLMPLIIRVLGRILAKVLGTSGAESFSTVADIFVGQTEAPLAIRPYIATLTQSELLACMVAGFATTAGGVLAAYVQMLHDLVPDVAGHFIACSVMCAPASLVVAKLAMPETDKPKTSGMTQITVPRSGSNVFDAIAAGTTDGLQLALNVGAMLIAFAALVALLNALLGWIGGLLTTWTHGAIPFGPEHPLDLQTVFGWIFYPIAWLLGVDGKDAFKVAGLLGEKTAMTEFMAYQRMSLALKADPAWISERSRLVASYALCGFANFASIGIQIGGYAALAPERRSDLSRLAFRAMIGGFLATCMVACLAGVFL